MDKKEEEFLKKLISIFKVEAIEHVNAITSGLIDLEKADANLQMGHIETIFREAHSLKGAARSVNLKEIESICQAMESVFSALKRNEIITSPQLFDMLHQAVDLVSKLISKNEEITVLEKSQIKEIIKRLEDILKDASVTPHQSSIIEKKEEENKTKVSEPDFSSMHSEPPELKSDIPENSQIQAPLITETVRISTVKLDSLLLQAEELVSLKLATGQHTTELQKINTVFTLWKRELAKAHEDIQIGQSSLETKDTVIYHNAKFLEILDPNNAGIKSLESKLTALAKSAQIDQRSLDGMVDNLLDDMKKVLMLPFSSLLGVFPKLVRDLSHDQGKDVDLMIQGEEIEIDRRILEEMKDPLIHLVRNCIDHGIEKPQVRDLKKKSPRGTVKIVITAKDSNKIEILVSDDGAGCDASELKSAAVKRGIISQKDASKLNEKEALSLVFVSGFSTSPIITDVSGRGLGLAIVHEKVEKLNGIISFETKIDSGSTFRIVIPLTLATFRGLLVYVNEQMFAIPVINVERVVRVKKDEIRTVEGLDTISLDGQIVSMVRLENVLELGGGEKNKTDDNVHVVVLRSGEKRMAYIVDEIVHEQEVLVKSLGKQLSRVRNIIGATILGNGKIAPILNVNDLMRSAVKVTYASAQAEEVLKDKPKRKSILEVDDSITARTLLKNILESAGYDVKTAVDGVDAFSALQTQEFDIIVSDVDMPRMNGFDLTSKIRNDRKLSELPVVLVTGLESRGDKERGIEVGANAYIVKSSFDQSNLLEVIQRLI
ncbi:MAG: hybrid sensor histidine kinase/response regulator [Candidatus Methanoperedens sp.]|nr:hybrid sensor histidine kinase/response regulator [Candidatus Methanoperedens sp.]